MGERSWDEAVAPRLQIPGAYALVKRYGYFGSLHDALLCESRFVPSDQAFELTIYMSDSSKLLPPTFEDGDDVHTILRLRIDKASEIDVSYGGGGWGIDDFEVTYESTGVTLRFNEQEEGTPV